MSPDPRNNRSEKLMRRIAIRASWVPYKLVAKVSKFHRVDSTNSFKRHCLTFDSEVHFSQRVLLNKHSLKNTVKLDVTLIGVCVEATSAMYQQRFGSVLQPVLCNSEGLKLIGTRESAMRLFVTNCSLVFPKVSKLLANG